MISILFSESQQTTGKKHKSTQVGFERLVAKHQLTTTDCSTNKSKDLKKLDENVTWEKVAESLDFLLFRFFLMAVCGCLVFMFWYFFEQLIIYLKTVELTSTNRPGF